MKPDETSRNQKYLLTWKAQRVCGWDPSSARFFTMEFTQIPRDILLYLSSGAHCTLHDDILSSSANFNNNIGELLVCSSNGSVRLRTVA